MRKGYFSTWGMSVAPAIDAGVRRCVARASHRRGALLIVAALHRHPGSTLPPLRSGRSIDSE
ncbi:MAG: hypothetical protein M3Q42_12855 [Pseudomonadota bacterium]|nr:hypothetical protein [Pseudomonadota bacterium]